MAVGLYREHLSDSDRALLTRFDGLHDPGLFRTLFRDAGKEAFLYASPFLAFAVLVERASRDLAHAGFLEEWVGPRERVPVFDVRGLRGFLEEPVHRLFLAELLASYTHVSSGSILVRTARGIRRQRFSELDPMHLIALADLSIDAERPAIYRRLGDCTLFLTGVFPDHTGPRLEQFETIGRRAYAIAWRDAAEAAQGTAFVLADVAQDGFRQARRILNHLTDRYLFPLRAQWFPSAG
jgi:hypothetical protein